MLIEGYYSEVEIEVETDRDDLAPHLTSNEARRLAKRLIRAADRADDLLPDGIYRVTPSDYNTTEAYHYREVKDGEVRSPAGLISLGNWIVHERIGDIPEGGPA